MGRGEVGGSEATIRIYCMKKNNFNKNKLKIKQNEKKKKNTLTFKKKKPI